MFAKPKLFILFLSLFLSFFFSVKTYAASSKEEIINSIDQLTHEDFLANRLIVKYKSYVESNFFAPKRDNVLKESNINVFLQSPLLTNASTTSSLKDTYLVSLAKTSATTLKKMVRDLNNNPNVEYAELDLKMSTTFTPNDPKFLDGTQWNLNKVEAPEAWDISMGSAQVVAGIVDTGIEKSHPELSNKVDNNPSECHGHGTHVAGIVAAETNNGQGIAGGGFRTHLRGYKVLGCDGSGSTSQIAQGINQAVADGVKTINLSLGGDGYSQTMCNAIDNAYDQGVIVLIAAGNSNSAIAPAPANCNSQGFGKTESLVVASTDSSDVKSSFSNYGSWVLVSAPGSFIYSTMSTPNNISSCNSSGYCTLSGTSMATPHVTALASLLRTVCPNKSADQIFSFILDNANNIDNQNPNFIGLLGSGRVNFAQSLAQAQSVCGNPNPTPTFTPTPTPTITPTPAPTATPTITPTPTRIPLVDCQEADLNNDGKVDQADVQRLKNRWYKANADLNGDNFVNGVDFTDLISCWNP